MGKRFSGGMLGPMALAAVLACGAAAAWAYAFQWCQKTLDDWVFHSASESLEITRDGRALIRHVQRADGTWIYTYRTLDGQEVTEPLVLTAPFVDLSPPPAKPELLGWSWRVLGFSDTRTVAAEWYLIRDDETPSRGNFAIYDNQTKNLVGYFGPQGFVSERPTPDEQFADIPRSGCEALPIVFDAYGWAQWNRTSSLYLIADGALWSIDLEKRSLRKIALAGEPVSVALASEETAGDVSGWDYRIVVRTRDQIVFLDKSGAPQRTLTIPADIRDRQLMACKAATNQVVLTAQTRGDVDIYWLGPADGAERHEHVLLAGIGSADEEPVTDWHIAMMFPAPGLQALTYPFFAYLQVETGAAPNVPTAVAGLAAKDWPAILAVWALSAILATICYRRHSRYTDRGGAAWALFVCLMGMPGAIGYWLHRRWPATERCADCGKVVPRDRDNCLACETAFAAPAPTGIEVFA